MQVRAAFTIDVYVVAASVILKRNVQRLMNVSHPMAQILEGFQLLLLRSGWRRQDLEVLLDVRLEEGWPASSDPTADSIEPSAAGGKPAGDEATPPTPLPDDDSEKVARLDQHRSRQ
jgi:hypothetical protein